MGKKTATSFKPGQSGNLKGRPLVPADIKSARQMNQIELERILNHVIFLPVPEINRLVRSKDAPAFLVGAAKIVQKVAKYGDLFAASFITDRLIGRPGNAPAIDVTPQLQYRPLSATPAVKDFTQFCLDAGYFPPFPKQEEMRAFVFGEDKTRLLLGARGYGKTDFCTIMGTAYELYKCQMLGLDASEHTNLIITKSKSRNTAICEEIATALEKNSVRLDKSNASVIRLEGLIGQDHSVEAITIKTSMRGRHPKRIIMDDPVTDEDTSEKMRDLVKKRYDEAYKLCKNIAIIGQPAHAHDLYAKLRDIIMTLLVPHGTIPDLDADLTAMKLAGIDEDSITMSYHLTVPESGTSPFSKIKYLDKFPNTDSVAFIDPSDGGDYTALSIMTGYFAGMAVQGHVFKKAWYHALPEIIPILKARGVRRLCFETNCTGNQPIEQLREALKPHGIGVVGVHSDTNKHAVIMAAGVYAHQIYLSKESDRLYTDHVVQYEYGAKFDDAPDSLARCLEWIGLIKGKK